MSAPRSLTERLSAADLELWEFDLRHLPTGDRIADRWDRAAYRVVLTGSLDWDARYGS